MSHFLGKLQKFSPLQARKFEKLHCKDMIFHGNPLHCKGPILEAKFWAERTVVLRSSAPSPTGEDSWRRTFTFHRDLNLDQS